MKPPHRWSSEGAGLERVYKIDRALRQRRCVSAGTLMSDLEVSLATLKRDLTFMRDRFHAPIVWNRDLGGYMFGAADPHAPPYRLPGLWLEVSDVDVLAGVLNGSDADTEAIARLRQKVADFNGASA